MATRLFSKDPLSWGQIFFLWVGGLSVVAIPVIAAALMAEVGDSVLSSADRLEDRAERLARGLPEINIPGITPTLGDMSVPDEELVAAIVEERSAETNLVAIEMEAVLERRRIADSTSVVRMREAQSARDSAERWFGGTIALLLLSTGGLAFLIWRSFHGADRAERQ